MRSGRGEVKCVARTVRVGKCFGLPFRFWVCWWWCGLVVDDVDVLDGKLRALEQNEAVSDSSFLSLLTRVSVMKATPSSINAVGGGGAFTARSRPFSPTYFRKGQTVYNTLCVPSWHGLLMCELFRCFTVRPRFMQRIRSQQTSECSLSIHVTHHYPIITFIFPSVRAAEESYKQYKYFVWLVRSAMDHIKQDDETSPRV